MKNSLDFVLQFCLDFVDFLLNLRSFTGTLLQKPKFFWLIGDNTVTDITLCIGRA